MTNSNHRGKRNLHVLHDDKFTAGAIDQFEKYYPDQNLYIILLNEGNELKYPVSNKAVYIYRIRDSKLKSNIRNMIRSDQVENLFIHYLDSFKASIANTILDSFPLKFYWIFYGGDLYGYLQQYCGYNVLDDQKKNPIPSGLNQLIKNIKYVLWFGLTPKRAMRKAFERVDYFCFWNEYDFELYQSYFKNQAKFKHFIYYHALGDPCVELTPKEDLVLINHSASLSGNHFYVLRLLSQLHVADSDYKLLIPISYGNPEYADDVAKQASCLFGQQVTVLRDFMPIEQYQAQLTKVKVAIFGMRRQEAAGNIFQLLNLGAKVFLREDNTLLKWLRNRGFVVFSIEEYLYDIGQLGELSPEDVIHNRQCYDKYFNPEKFRDMMTQLIDV